MLKHVLCLLLAGLLCLVPLSTARASGGASETSAQHGAAVTGETLSGTIGTDNNISWRIDDGVLTISGTGRMPSAATTWYYFEEHPENAPWKEHKEAFSAVVIEEGVTRVGTYAFRGCDNIRSVTLPAGLTSIGEFAFADCTGLSAVDLPEGLAYIETGAFAGSGVSRADTKLPDSLISIGQDAFYQEGEEPAPSSAPADPMRAVLILQLLAAGNTLYTSADAAEALGAGSH